MAFKFPASIDYENCKWHLIYAPDDPNTVMPNLAGSQVVSVTCDPVRVSGRDTPIYMAVFNVLFPPRQRPDGTMVGERRMKGFRTFSAPPLNPQGIMPNDCVFYLAEQQGDGGSETQRFFDALVGQAERRAKADASWCKDFAKIQGGGDERVDGADAAQCAVSDGQLPNGEQPA